MLRFLILLAVVVGSLSAKNPKLYSGIGDPLYREAEIDRKIAMLYAFKEDKQEIEAFIERVEQAKAAGLQLEKQKDPDAAKKYLQKLRALNSEKEKIRHLVKRRLQEAITSDFTKRYQQITATKHPLFREDRSLTRAMQGYERRLAQRNRIEEKRYQQFLRSPAHLAGTWSREGMHWKFMENRLTITKMVGTSFQEIRGTWKLEPPHFVHHVTQVTNQDNSGIPHIRETDTTQYFELLSVTATTLKVKDIYGETHILTKE